MISVLDINRGKEQVKKSPSDLQGRSFNRHYTPRPASPFPTRVIETVRTERALRIGFLSERVLQIAHTSALVETANRRNRLHHRGTEARRTTKTHLAGNNLILSVGSVAVMAQIQGMHGGVLNNGYLSVALVQGPPLQAVWYCMTH